MPRAEKLCVITITANPLTSVQCGLSQESADWFLSLFDMIAREGAGTLSLSGTVHLQELRQSHYNWLLAQTKEEKL